MKTIGSFLFILIGLIILHTSIYQNSERIALDYAIPYVAMSNEDAYQAAYNRLSASDREWNVIMGKPHVTQDSVAILKEWHHREYISEYVSPIKDKIEIGVGIFFSITYIILAFFVGRVSLRWMQANGGRIIFTSSKRIEYFSVGLLSRMGLKKLFLNHRLKLAQTEFLRLKSLFDNGLITEGEFLAKKVEIERKIRNENLLNK